MPRLLHRSLITLRLLTLPDIPLQSLPPLAQRPQLPLQHKRNTKVHHNIRHANLISEQKLASTLLQFCGSEVQICLNVFGQSDFGLRGVAGLLVPAGIHDGDAVQGEGAFGCVDPLEHGVALGVSNRWEEAVVGIVDVTEVSGGPC